MWAVRTVFALKRWPSKNDMNNDRADRTLDIREMTELPRTNECDQPDRRLIEREFITVRPVHLKSAICPFIASCFTCILLFACGSACAKLTILHMDPRYSSRAYRPGIDVNLYATKKSVAQGMMDIALLTANASQLKYILKEEESKFYLLNVICIGISIILQLVVGVLLILNTRYNINMVSHQSKAELINNLTIIGIFLITVSNVFISAFGTSPR